MGVWIGHGATSLLFEVWFGTPFCFLLQAPALHVLIGFVLKYASADSLLIFSVKFHGYLDCQSNSVTLFADKTYIQLGNRPHWSRASHQACCLTTNWQLRLWFDERVWYGTPFWLLLQIAPCAGVIHFFFKNNLFKNTSLRFSQDYEQLEPRSGKVKNKNAFFFK